MRVKTGFLRASLMASTSQMPSINLMAKPSDDAPDNSFAPDPTATLVIAGADIGHSIFLDFTAAHARPETFSQALAKGKREASG